MPTEQIDLFDENEAVTSSNERGVGESGADAVQETKLEDRTTHDLELLFEEKVGFSAQTRFLGRSDAERRTVLIEGINNPTKGKDAVAEWDADYDKIGDAWSGK